MSDWKSLREQAGMTLAELSAESGYSIGTINGLELHGEGSARLKTKLREILTPLSKIKESVKQVDSESVSAGIELRQDSVEHLTTTEWKQRAIKAESEVERLRAALHTLTAPRVSSKPNADVEQILDATEDAERRRRSKP